MSIIQQAAKQHHCIIQQATSWRNNEKKPSIKWASIIQQAANQHHSGEERELIIYTHQRRSLRWCGPTNPRYPLQSCQLLWSENPFAPLRVDSRTGGRLYPPGDLMQPDREGGESSNRGPWQRDGRSHTFMTSKAATSRRRKIRSQQIPQVQVSQHHSASSKAASFSKQHHEEPARRSHPSSEPASFSKQQSSTIQERRENSLSTPIKEDHYGGVDLPIHGIPFSRASSYDLKTLLHP